MYSLFNRYDCYDTGGTDRTCNIFPTTYTCLSLVSFLISSLFSFQLSIITDISYRYFLPRVTISLDDPPDSRFFRYLAVNKSGGETPCGGWSICHYSSLAPCKSWSCLSPPELSRTLCYSFFPVSLEWKEVCPQDKLISIGWVLAAVGWGKTARRWKSSGGNHIRDRSEQRPRGSRVLLISYCTEYAPDQDIFCDKSLSGL